MRTIEGRTQYSRFGYAMANLGDINGDGFDGKYNVICSNGYSTAICDHDCIKQLANPLLLLKLQLESYTRECYAIAAIQCTNNYYYLLQLS